VVATSIVLRASCSLPVWKKIAVPSEAKAGEKALATCSTSPLGALARASLRTAAGGGTIS
jgi:hypothetical protein